MENKIVIIGYSGHSFCCIESALEIGYEVVGYYDKEKKLHNPYNLKFLGKDNDIQKKYHPFISIGDNVIRKKVFNSLVSKNINIKTSIINSKTIISNSSSIQNQTFVNAGVIINAKVEIGVGCILNTGAIIDHETKIGNFTHVAPGAVIAGNVKIGNNCLIGANSVIKQDLIIEDNVIIGAGSVVVKNVKKNSIIVGNPAKKLKADNQ